MKKLKFPPLFAEKWGCSNKSHKVESLPAGRQVYKVRKVIRFDFIDIKDFKDFTDFNDFIDYFYALSCL